MTPSPRVLRFEGEPGFTLSFDNLLAINPAECDKDSCLKPDADVLAMRPPSPVSRLIDSEQTLESTRRSAKSRPGNDMRI